jgi:hypothetical protein
MFPPDRVSQALQQWIAHLVKNDTVTEVDARDLKK